MKRIILSVYLSFSCSLFAQPGTLDPAFGNNGIVNTPGLTGQVEVAYAIAVQSDGKIVAAGVNVYNICIKRFNSNGSLDTSFGNQGEVIQSLGEINNDNISDIAIQPDGKIIVVGSVDSHKHMFVARYNPNGTPDTNFGTAGIVTLDVYPNSTSLDEVAGNVFVLSDGKIILTGSISDISWMAHYPVIAKYNANGTPDTSFGGIGVIQDSDIGSPEAAACLPDGKIVLLFTEYIDDDYVAVFKRYDQTGMADISFGTGGMVYVSGGIDNFVCRDITAQPDGKIVAGGMGIITPGLGDFSIVRLNYNGTLDPTFGNNGISLQTTTPAHDEVQKIIVQPDGKIVAAGLGQGGQSFVVARYNSTGSVDTTFGTGGVVSTSMGSETHQTTGLAVQPDGKIVTSNIVYNGPPYNFYLMRYFGSGGTTGIEDQAMTGMVIYPNPATNFLNISNPENTILDVVSISDVSGKIIMQQTGNTSQIDVQNLSPGIYFLKINYEGKERQHKFIKQ